jgi:hypothetical protein
LKELEQPNDKDVIGGKYLRWLLIGYFHVQFFCNLIFDILVSTCTDSFSTPQVLPYTITLHDNLDKQRKTSIES